MSAYEENVIFDWFMDGDYYESIFRGWMSGCAGKGMSESEAADEITDLMNAFLRKIWYSAQDDIQDSLAKDLYLRDWGEMEADVEEIVWDLLDNFEYRPGKVSASKKGTKTRSRPATSKSCASKPRAKAPPKKTPTKTNGRC